MAKTISGIDLRSINRTVPANFDKKEFIKTEEPVLNLDSTSSQPTVNEIVTSLTSLEKDFDSIFQRLKDVIPLNSIPLEEFDEGTIECIQKIFGETSSFDTNLYFKLLDIQLLLGEEIANEELEKQGII